MWHDPQNPLTQTNRLLCSDFSNKTLITSQPFCCQASIFFHYTLPRASWSCLPYLRPECRATFIPTDSFYCTGRVRGCRQSQSCRKTPDRTDTVKIGQQGEWCGNHNRRTVSGVCSLHLKHFHVVIWFYYDGVMHCWVRCIQGLLKCFTLWTDSTLVVSSCIVHTMHHSTMPKTVSICFLQQ